MSVTFPEAPAAIPASPHAEIDRALGVLHEKRAEYAALGIDERITLLRSIQQALAEVSNEWGRLDGLAKGAFPGSPGEGDAVLTGPAVTMRNVRLLIAALEDVRDFGAPRIPPGRLSTRPDGRLVVSVFPNDIWDRMIFLGYSAEVWMQPGVDRHNLTQHQAGHYRRPRPDGAVALILGAGNQSSIPPMDALYKLFVEQQVVILKMNPVNEYLGPLFRRMFQPMVDRGYLEVVYGGAEQGSYLCQHSKVDTIHITGSDQTHDAIVWGPSEGRDERKAAGQPVLHKEITSELGNVTPIIVVPGDWSERQLSFQAENVAAMVTNNASFNCIAGKLLIVSDAWPLRERFLELVRDALRKAPPKKAYYPGATTRWRQFVDAYPQAEILGETQDDVVPWTLIPGHTPDQENRLAFQREPFCGLLHELRLPQRNAADFLDRAVTFCNDEVWGTLGISILISPDSRHDPSVERAFQRALDDLRYGSIVINHWPGLAYGIVNTAWGAYPGHRLDDIQSGRGVVHNTFLFDQPQKSIVYGPFMPLLRPPWFHTHGGVHELAPRLVRFEAAPSLGRLLPILPSAIK